MQFSLLSRLRWPWPALPFLLAGCVAPSQHFTPGSARWLQANPEFSASGSVERLVRIAVLDGGIDYNHPRLSPQIDRFVADPALTGRAYGIGLDLLGGDYFPGFQVVSPDNGEDLSAFLGVREHGTHVSALATLGDKRIGLVPVRVLPVADENPGDGLFDRDRPLWEERLAIHSLVDVERGLDFGVDHGAQIVNMSLGFSLGELPEANRARVMEHITSQLLPKVSSAWSGALLVVAAGNERTVLTQPHDSVPATLDSPDLLAVGALKDHGRLAEYTNHGRYVDVYMRGSDVSAAVPGGSRAKLSGTSMASPLVAHLAAQLKMLDPALKPAEIRALILNTADLRELDQEAADGGSLAESPTPALPARRTVRVASFLHARMRLRELLAHPESRAARLVAPWAHGRSPH